MTYFQKGARYNLDEIKKGEGLKVIPNIPFHNVTIASTGQYDLWYLKNDAYERPYLLKFIWDNKQRELKDSIDTKVDK